MVTCLYCLWVGVEAVFHCGGSMWQRTSIYLMVPGSKEREEEDRVSIFPLRTCPQSCTPSFQYTPCPNVSTTSQLNHKLATKS